MDALDIISVDEAKKWLVIEIEPSDTIAVQEVERLIKTSIAWIEKYTSYRLYDRDEYINNSKCEQSVAAYPINTITVTNQDNETVAFKKYETATKTRIICPFNSKITLNVGFTDAANIPQPLIDGCFKLITYLYENRDIYQAQLPSDVQMLVNQYRRALI